MNFTQAKKFFLCSFATIALTTCMATASRADNKNITYSDPLKPIVVEKSHALFAITVQSNPTTGFLWSLKGFDTNLIKPISRTYYPPQNSGLVGRGGYEKWLFAVKPAGFVVPQTTNITLIYARYSDMDGAQRSNFMVVTSNAH